MDGKSFLIISNPIRLVLKRGHADTEFGRVDITEFGDVCGQLSFFLEGLDFQVDFADDFFKVQDSRLLPPNLYQVVQTIMDYWQVTPGK